MCQPVILSTVFSGKHCNCCQTLDKIFAKAIERLYLHKTCTSDVPAELQVVCLTHYEEFGKVRSLEFVKKHLTDDNSVKDNALAGKFGNTSQSRFQYCNLVNLHQMLHYVMNIYDFDESTDAGRCYYYTVLFTIKIFMIITS